MRNFFRAWILCLLALACAASPALSAQLLPNGKQTFLDSNGHPLSSGFVYFYIPSTTTFKTTWQDPLQTIPNPNPIRLDTAGRAIIYGSGQYRELVTDIVGNTIWDQLTSDSTFTGVSFAGTSSGSPNNQTLTDSVFNSTDGQQISFIAGFSNSGPLALTINGGIPIPVDKNTTSGLAALSGGEVVAGNLYTVTYSASLGVFVLSSIPNPTIVPNPAPLNKRQTVYSGPQVGGLPTFLPATSGSLTITTTGIAGGSNALVLTAAQGSSLGVNSDSTIALTTNNSWSGLAANTTNFLGYSISGGIATPITTTLAPVYQDGGTPSIGAGQYTFDFQAMKMFLGNGSVANQITAIFVGEADTNGTTVTATRAYAYQGYYDSGFINADPGQTLIQPTNIGVLQQEVQFVIQNTIPNGGFAVGDQLIDPYTSYTVTGVVNYGPVNIGNQRNNAILKFGNTNRYSALFAGAITNMVVGDWQYKVVAYRTWN